MTGLCSCRLPVHEQCGQNWMRPLLSQRTQALSVRKVYGELNYTRVFRFPWQNFYLSFARPNVCWLKLF